MIIPEIKNIHSPDLPDRTLPGDVNNCSVLIEVEIGPKGGKGADVFSFVAITPEAIKNTGLNGWGRGYYLMTTFSWETIEHKLARLLSHCAGKDWEEVANKLNKELHWEFENYREYDP